MKTRIALIHALTMSIDPVARAFRELWPEAETMNLLDDSLSVDRERAGTLTPAIAARIAALADYGVRCGAEGVLYTCSAFGEAIEAVARASKVPVLKPNEAMFAEAMERGRRIALLLTFQPSVAGMEAEFRSQSGQSGPSLVTFCVPEAMAALQRGDRETHDRLVVETAREASKQGFEALMLGQFSMAPARAAVQAVMGCPVLTSPDSAVRRLKRLFARA